MAYIALKPCTFAGQKFKIGDSIPGDVLLPGAIKNLVKMEIIASTDGKVATMPVPNGPIAVTARAEGGNMDLQLTDIGLQQIFDALTANVEGAEKIVETMTDEDALILLHMCDSRKGVKAAAEARAKALEAPEEEEIPEEEEAQEEQEIPEEETDDSAGEE